MSFVDEIRIQVVAGDGGDGVVRWRHEKFREFGGPSGGDGGKGGDVVVKATRDIGYLAKYQQNQLLKADSGEDGRSKSQAGKDGQNLIIWLPVGSVVTCPETNEQWELLTEGQEEIVATGGLGGLGNEHFKSSTNQAPKEATLGKPGEQKRLQIELRLIADIGLVGFPNAGKTSLLNALTNAKGKVGNYQFTTLEPNLGVLREYVIADIPGLIEHASEGKGLGHKFLRHISRTRFILHCISCKRDDLARSYEIIRNELGQYDSELVNKPELVLLTQVDELPAPEIQAKQAELEKVISSRVCVVSVLDDALLKSLSDQLTTILKEL